MSKIGVRSLTLASNAAIAPPRIRTLTPMANLRREGTRIYDDDVDRERLERPRTVLVLRPVRETLANRAYRRVVDTTQQMQQVVMHITPEQGGIHAEVHPYSSQYVSIVAGRGVALIEDRLEIELLPNVSFIVPANTKHEIVNTGSEALALYTIYAPPVHPPGLVQQTKVE